jgi:hypothetical protein
LFSSFGFQALAVLKSSKFAYAFFEVRSLRGRHRLLAKVVALAHCLAEHNHCQINTCTLFTNPNQYLVDKVWIGKNTLMNS